MSSHSPAFILGFFPGVVHSMGLDRWIRTCVLSHSVMQRSPPSKSPIFQLSTSSFPFAPVTMYPFTISIVLHFPKCIVVEILNM
jgi:hypothetical protein